MKIREAHQNDIQRMHEIRVAVKENVLSDPNRITPADYELFLFRRGKGWVCEVNDAIAGFAIADVLDENIWALFVDPSLENRGIGKALQKQMLDWYFAQKEKVWLGTAPGTRAEQFYRRTGWRENGKYGAETRFEMTVEEWRKVSA